MLTQYLRTIKHQIWLFSGLFGLIVFSGCASNRHFTESVISHKIPSGDFFRCHYRNSILKSIDYFNGEGEMFLSLKFSGAFSSSARLQVLNARREYLFDSNLKGKNSKVLYSSESVFYLDNREDLADQTIVRRQWWHDDGYLILEQLLIYDSHSKLIKVNMSALGATDINWNLSPKVKKS